MKKDLMLYLLVMTTYLLLISYAIFVMITEIFL